MPSSSDVAASFGYTLAFFNADPELKRLLAQATTGAGWTEDRFIASLRNTRWFRTHGESYRKWAALKASDPASLAQQMASASARIQQLGATVGIPRFSPGNLRSMAERSLQFGWTDEQAKAALFGFVHTDRVLAGGGATAQRYVDETLAQFGVAISATERGALVKGLILGTASQDQVRARAVGLAASKYPGLADRLKAGETLEGIADPYRQSYGTVLEVNPQTIALTDAKIQKALTSKDAAGKPTTQTIWQFEQDLRKDPRWLATKNAQDSLVGTTKSVLQSFGLVS